jgi:hypothetical protein
MDSELLEKYAEKIYNAVQGTPTRNRSKDLLKQLIVAQLIQMTMEANGEEISE